MVTRNPAHSLGWGDKFGSIEAGKVADLLLLRQSAAGASVYSRLVEASERDVGLVLVGGDSLAGDPDLMVRLKPGDHELVASSAGGFTEGRRRDDERAVPDGGETLAQLASELELRSGAPVATGREHHLPHL